MGQRSLLYKAAHFAYGVISCLAYLHDPWLGLINVAFYHAYQLVEYLKLRDRLYVDLREFYAGFGSATAVKILLMVMGVQPT